MFYGVFVFFVFVCLIIVNITDMKPLNIGSKNYVKQQDSKNTIPTAAKSIWFQPLRKARYRLLRWSNKLRIDKVKNSHQPSIFKGLYKQGRSILTWMLQIFVHYITRTHKNKILHSRIFKFYSSQFFFFKCGNYEPIYTN